MEKHFLTIITKTKFQTRKNIPTKNNLKFDLKFKTPLHWDKIKVEAAGLLVIGV